MLNGIHLIDFGNHCDTRLTFKRMTALVGQNSAGKTNAMRAIMKAAVMFKRRKKNVSDAKLVRKGSIEWKISVSWSGILNDQKGDWAMGGSSKRDFPWLWRASVPEDCKNWLPDPQVEWKEFPTWDEIGTAKLTGLIRQGTVVRPSESLAPRAGWVGRYFKTAGSYLQEPSYSEDIPPALGENCRDLAWMISYLKGDKDEVFNNIIEALREVVPVVRRVRHRPVAVAKVEQKSIIVNKQERLFDEEQQVMGQELRFDMASGEDLPANAISEGTLVTLAILTAVMQDGSGGSQTILLDDIESGLHPKAQRDLVRQLRRLQETRPELQIIFSSYSPYIIDEMKPEEVWLFAADKEGCAHCAKLSEHPDASRALEVLTTGEFWSAEGEDWVLDPEKRQRKEEEKQAAAK